MLLFCHDYHNPQTSNAPTMNSKGSHQLWLIFILTGPVQAFPGAIELLLMLPRKRIDYSQKLQYTPAAKFKSLGTTYCIVPSLI